MGKVEVGALIRQGRERKGWTQEKLADELRRRGLGTTANYLGKLEHGWAIPGEALRLALSQVLDIPIGRFFEAAGMLEGVLRPRADQGDGDWLDAAVERLRDDPEFAESYRLMLEQDATPEVREAQLRALVALWITSVKVLTVGLKE